MAPNNERDVSMASTSRATTSTNEGSGTAKYSAKPDFFYGDRNKLDDWLNQIMLYFPLEGITNEQRRCRIAASYLRGEA